MANLGRDMQQAPRFLTPNIYEGAIFKFDSSTSGSGRAIKCRVNFSIVYVAEHPLYVPDTEDNINHVIMLALTEINKADREKCATLDAYHAILAANFASAILAVWPELKEPICEDFKINGLKINEVKLPSDCEANQVEMVDPPEAITMMIFLAQLVLMPFKNLDSRHYKQYMMKRIAAFSAGADNNSPAENLLAITDASKVEIIKARFGCNHIFRRKLLFNIMERADAPGAEGIIFSHVLQMLHYTDMGSFKTIHDTLLVNQSPVINDSSVQREVINLAKASYMANSFSHPQFFRILGPPKYFNLFERGRFPILFTVAQRLKEEEYSSVKQFTTTIHTGSPLVESLLALHREFVRNNAAVDANARTLANLTLRNSSEPDAAITEVNAAGGANV